MRRLGVVAAAVLGLVAVAVPASAHVTVNPNTAVQGGYARLAFRVPTESDTDSTTKLEVHLPDDAPVASVMTSPVPGWTATVTKRKLDKPIDVHGSPVSEVVSVVTWTASADAAIKPSQFQEFPISLGPLPKVDQMVFKTLQTYSDGTVVRWIDEPTNDGTEAENPAPVLKLTAAAAGEQAAPTTAATVPLAQDAKADGGSDWTGVAGLVAGVLALIVAGLALARTRKPTGSA
nr:YcnI family protein [Catellatospora tritici]